jgi:hypothetical protein
MTALWPLEFRLDIPSGGVGVAGAGVKLGCVYYEAAGFAFNGTINPLEIFVKIGLDIRRKEIYFESRFGDVYAHDFQFHHWPQIRFPLDQVADFMLARVTEMLITGQTGRLLNATRFSLTDFGLFRGFGRMVSRMAVEQSRAKTSVTVGVTFEKA